MIPLERQDRFYIQYPDTGTSELPVQDTFMDLDQSMYTICN